MILTTYDDKLKYQKFLHLLPTCDKDAAGLETLILLKGTKGGANLPTSATRDYNLERCKSQRRWDLRLEG